MTSNRTRSRRSCRSGAAGSPDAGPARPARPAEALLTCALTPLRLAFVGWDGRVFPCVSLGLPVEGGFERWWGGRAHPVHPVSPPVLGHLDHESLGEIDAVLSAGPRVNSTGRAKPSQAEP